MSILPVNPLTIGQKIAGAMIAFGLVVGVTYLGVHHLISVGEARAEAKYDQKILAMQQQITQLIQAQSEVSGKIDKLARQKATAVRSHGHKLQEKVHEIPHSVPPIDGSYRVLHDAAASGSPLPDAASLPDGASVPVADAAATVIDNYTGCRENTVKLEAFQQWVREQAALTAKAQKDLAKTAAPTD